MIQETVPLSLDERREVAKTLLRPDAIRNHRVAEGLQLTDEQVADLEACASLIRDFTVGMDAISQAALDASSGDRLMRTVRTLLGTESLHQARLRGDTPRTTLSAPRLAKADLILTPEGFKIVEIEPGKIRGLGYGRMVREQAARPVGIGSEAALAEITANRPTTLVLSETDKFHLPEMRLLGRFVTNLVVAQQHELMRSGAAVQARGATKALDQTVDQAIMMSPLHNGHGITEQRLREAVQVVSDRRLDLESKGALALLHNAGNIPELEDVLTRHFGPDSLKALREAIPLSLHTDLLSDQEASSVKAAVLSGELPVFLKPLANSGTRGIVLPGELDEAQTILSSKKAARNVVLQQALEGVRIDMESIDVLSGDARRDLMSLRITLHVDAKGNIIEASVVGSPHKDLAHGGKTSVITNLEMPR